MSGLKRAVKDAMIESAFEQFERQADRLVLKRVSPSRPPPLKARLRASATLFHSRGVCSQIQKMRSDPYESNFMAMGLEKFWQHIWPEARRRPFHVFPCGECGSRDCHALLPRLLLGARSHQG